jgi:hypothetical protein
MPPRRRRRHLIARTRSTRGLGIDVGPTGATTGPRAMHRRRSHNQVPLVRRRRTRAALHCTGARVGPIRGDARRCVGAVPGHPSVSATAPDERSPRLSTPSTASKVTDTDDIPPPDPDDLHRKPTRLASEYAVVRPIFKTSAAVTRSVANPSRRTFCAIHGPTRSLPTSRFATIVLVSLKGQ